jgi:ubiquinone/menaquinone biosynthesis C-methylase UbiE
MKKKITYPPKAQSSSWETSADWYDKIVGTQGHYYHEHLILPRTLRLLSLSENCALLDLACGQGILSRHIPRTAAYTGVDISPSLIRAAQQRPHPKEHLYAIGDVTKPLPVKNKQFTHAAIILALQNIQDPLAVLKNAAIHLKTGGKLCIVLNHPCFRIPRQSSWQVDPAKKLQYRRIERYFSPLEIPIATHPGQKAATEQTISFHHPLSAFSGWLHQAGFVIEVMEEWCSDKKSEGAAARMEDRARKEFPLFLTILASKVHL